MPIKDAYEALKAVTASSAYVELVAGPGGLPAELSGLLTTSAREAITALQGKTSPVAADAISQESNLQKSRGYYKVENWASGGEPFVRFKTQAVTAYVQALFDMVASRIATKSNVTTVLSRNNLFHGHLVFETFGQVPDVLLVFHAFEYPSDLEPDKSNHAQTLEPGVPGFTSQDPAFKWRNAIWSMRLNRIWLICGDKASPYRELLDGTKLTTDGDPFVIDESKLGARIADVNIFPNEGVASFLHIF